MSSMSKEKSFQELHDELEELIAWFESGDVDIDQAASKFEQGQKIIEELEARLKSAELKIKKQNKSA